MPTPVIHAKVEKKSVTNTRRFANLRISVMFFIGGVSIHGLSEISLLLSSPAFCYKVIRDIERGLKH